MKVRRFLLLFLIIALGLLSRKVSLLPQETGDALWAMMVFCLMRIVMPKAGLLKVSLMALAISFAVEFSQLIRWQWLVDLRSTTVGHLVLGQGFLWKDLVAYTIGIVLIYTASSLSEKYNRNNN